MGSKGLTITSSTPSFILGIGIDGGAGGGLSHIKTTHCLKRDHRDCTNVVVVVHM
jgi:hypothetical protein